MTLPLSLTSLLAGVLISDDLAVGWPVLCVIAVLAGLLAEARFKISDLRERLNKVETRQDGLQAAQNVADNRLVRVETSLAHIVETTTKTHALVQAMAAGLKAA